MEKGFFNTKNIALFFLVVIIISGILFAMIFSHRRIIEFNAYIDSIISNIIANMNFWELFKINFTKYMQRIIIIAIVCKTAQKKYIKYVLFLYYLITMWQIVLVMFMAGNIKTGMVMFIIFGIHIFIFSIITCMLFYKKSCIKYFLSVVFCILLCLLENFLYLKIVARIILS